MEEEGRHGVDAGLGGSLKRALHLQKGVEHRLVILSETLQYIVSRET